MVNHIRHGMLPHFCFLSHKGTKVTKVFGTAKVQVPIILSILSILSKKRGLHRDCRRLGITGC